MFDGMFNLSESFTQDFLAPPSPPQSQSDDVSGTGRVVPERVLGKGVLHSTIATLHNLARQNAFEESDIKAFSSEWSQAIITGWITELDDAEEGVITGQICDGTGCIDFRYELASDMPESYHIRIRRLGPKDTQAKVAKQPEDATGLASHDESVSKEETQVSNGGIKQPPQEVMQIPTRMIGSPTLMNDGILFVASHLKAATADEVISSHFLECGLTILRGAATPETESDAMSCDKENAPRLSEPLGVDPYYGEEVPIPEEVGAFMEGPQNRIKRVIWRFLDEASRKEFNTSKSESCVAIRSFCGKMWKEKEIESALDSMDEDGILFYMDASKERVALV